MLLLRAEQTSVEWIDRENFLHKKRGALLPPRRKSISRKSNILTKTNTELSIVNDFNSSSIVEDFVSSFGGNDHLENESNKIVEQHILEPKIMYNNTIDAFNMIENQKGFLIANANANTSTTKTTETKLNNRIIGIYCIRWRRHSETAGNEIKENETKLIVNCIEIIEAPLNVSCYLDEKMYVKVPMTLLITLTNTTNSTLHLKSFLKNADNFMFAGHSQVN